MAHEPAAGEGSGTDGAVDSTAATTETFTPGTVLERMARALEENPGYVSLGQAAKILKRSKGTVYEYHSDLPGKVVYGVRLYERTAVEKRARDRSRVIGSRIVVTGINVERLRKICEVYYRTQFDIAPIELKRLAKSIARV